MICSFVCRPSLSCSTYGGFPRIRGTFWDLGAPIIRTIVFSGGYIFVAPLFQVVYQSYVPA